MRSTQSSGRDTDHLPEVIDPEGHTEVLGRKRAQAAHPILIGPDPRVHAGSPARCADNLTQVIDAVSFTPSIARRRAQFPDDRGVFPQTSAMIAVGGAGNPDAQT